jgi:hypothetical protein
MSRPPFRNDGHVSTIETSREEVSSGPSARPPIFTLLPLIGLAALLVRFTALAAGPIKDPDAWWHLRVGREFLEGRWTLRDTGPLSTFATETWTPRDWLPQLAASKMESLFGLPGVAWLYGASLIAFLLVGYFVCRRFADPLPAALATTLAAIGASGSLSQRPQMISFTLLFVVVGAWLATASDGKPRWWLVPLTWLWAMCHGMWYCAVAVGVVTVAGILLDRRVDIRRSATLAAIPLLSFAATGLTPVGPKLWLTVFDTTGMWQYVSEWQPASFREPAPAATVLAIFVIVACWARGAGAVPWSHIGLLSCAVGWTLLSGRTVALGAVVAAPLVASLLQSQQRSNRKPIRRYEPVFLGCVAAACLSTLALVAPTTAQAAGNVPDAFDASLDAQPDGAVILNDYALGGWLHWSHPDLQTVVDGFTDGYTPQAVAAFLDATAVSEGWEDYVSEVDPDLALLPTGSPLAVALVDRLNWESKGTDAGYVLLSPGR